MHPKNPHEVPLTLGQRMADHMTSFMGSWPFIALFVVCLISWMFVNVLVWWYAWDPYPFILLNLVLSCLAAIQAPIILMSQKREEERDRMNLRYDYAVNRKAEKEIQEIQRSLAHIRYILEKKKKK